MLTDWPERYFVISRIEINQQLPFLDPVRILHVDADDRAVDARADRIGMAVDLSVVGRFVAFKILKQQISGDEQDNHADNDENGRDRMSAYPPSRALDERRLLLLLLLVLSVFLIFASFLILALLLLILVLTLFLLVSLLLTLAVLLVVGTRLVSALVKVALKPLLLLPQVFNFRSQATLFFKQDPHILRGWFGHGTWRGIAL